MFYSAIGIIALLILVIENKDILFRNSQAFNLPVWRTYRRFLFAVLAYYLTDILWGAFEALKLPAALFADTTIYFIAMASGILFWTTYVVTYLEEKKLLGYLIKVIGYSAAAFVIVSVVINIFTPIMFSVDENCVYLDHIFRDITLIVQIAGLFLLAAYVLISMARHRDKKDLWPRYRIISVFCLIMAVFLMFQLWFPYLPAYATGYLLGTCLLRVSIIRLVREEYHARLEEAEKVKLLKASISSLLDNMPALSFSKDASTGVYLACNQAFAEYAHKDSPEGVIGLTDAEIFDPRTAQHFIEDDRMALSMDTPYSFYEDVPDAAGNQRQFQTTKLKYYDADGRLCILGMCEDVTDMVRIRRENATTKEAYEKARSSGIIFTHIAQTLAHGYEDLYYINHYTGEYIEYHTDEETGSLVELRRGQRFFASVKKDAGIYVYPEDQDSVVQALDRDTLLKALEKNGTFAMTYRLMADGKPSYVSMMVSRMEDDERFIILGVTNVDEEMKQRRAAERAEDQRIAYARLNALIGEFLCIYVVVPETGQYREFSSTESFRSFDLPMEGSDFFASCRENGKKAVYQDDLERYLSAVKRETVLSEIAQSGIFTLTYRLLINGRPNYVQLKAAMVEEKDGRRLVVGINDIDTHVRQEQDYARRLALAQSKANIDALTGVKSKHAYLDEEERLDRMIEEHGAANFAIVILDVNDLKKVNDTKGHQAGDQYIQNACKIICDTFKRSPVFRVGGDEFAVVAQGEDYASIEELVGRINDHNADANLTGGIVVACGMAKYENDGCVATVFERADNAMYENKGKLKECVKRDGSF